MPISVLHPITANIKTELEKLKVAIQSKAHTVMDLSTGGDIPAIRQAIIASLSPAGRYCPNLSGLCGSREPGRCDGQDDGR